MKTGREGEGKEKKRERRERGRKERKRGKERESEKRTGKREEKGESLGYGALVLSMLFAQWRLKSVWVCITRRSQ